MIGDYHQVKSLKSFLNKSTYLPGRDHQGYILDESSLHVVFVKTSFTRTTQPNTLKLHSKRVKMTLQR